MGRVEGGVREREEVLSHLISLDTRHPASLKQPLTPVYNPLPRLKCCARAYTHILKNKDRADKHLGPVGAIIDAENGGNWDEDKSREEEGPGENGKVEYVSAES